MFTVLNQLETSCTIHLPHYAKIKSGSSGIIILPYSRKIWRALNLANWLSVGIGELLIWQSEFLAPYIDTHTIIHIGGVFNLAIFTEFAKSPN